VKSGPVRWALRLYPRWWRERYGAELHDLADELVAAGATTEPRAAAGLVIPAALERSRALRRRGAKLALVGLALIAVAGISLAAVTSSRSPVPRAVASKPTARIELVTFMNPAASTQEITVLGRVIAGMEPGHLKSCRYVGKSQAFAEFKRVFGSEPHLLAGVDAAKMPTSFWCVPAAAPIDPASLAHEPPGWWYLLASRLAQQPGVYHVALETWKK
jgi:hypothetical protein